MRAAVANRLGGPEVLEEATLADPVPGPGRGARSTCAPRPSTVGTAACGSAPSARRTAARARARSRRSRYVLGSDGAGVVVERGPGVQSPLEGAEVVINPALFWGDSELAPADDLAGRSACPGRGRTPSASPSPRTTCGPSLRAWTWQHAAALPLAGLTAWRALTTRAQVAPGERVLVPGCGSGVATYLIQFARDLGAEVVVSSSSRAKLERALALGASSGVLYTDPDWTRQVGEVDVIVDSAGAPIWQSLNGLLRHGGRLVSFGRTAGGTRRGQHRQLLPRPVDASWHGQRQPARVRPHARAPRAGRLACPRSTPCTRSRVPPTPTPDSTTPPVREDRARHRVAPAAGPVGA